MKHLWAITYNYYYSLIQLESKKITIKQNCLTFINDLKKIKIKIRYVQYIQ